MAAALALALLVAAAPRIAVMPIAAGEAITDKSAASFTETLAGELRQQSGAQVVTSRDLGSLLSLEKQKQALGCTSDTCMAEIAGAAGADRLVAGDVAKLGESLVVQLRLLDVRRAAVLSQSRRRFKKGTFDDLLDALPAMVGELLQGAPAIAELAPPNPPPGKAAPSPTPQAAGPSPAPSWTRPQASGSAAPASPSGSAAPASPASPPPRGQWTRLAPIDPPRHGIALAAVGGKLYAFGGWTNGAPVNTAQVYDPATQAWRSLPPLPTARNEAQVAVVDGRIYVIGGYSDHSESVVEVFDPATSQWSRRAPLPAPRAGSATAVLDGRIYVLCGWTDETVVYDPRSDRWERRAPIPSGRHVRGVAGVVGGKIYVMAGDTSGSVDIFDPATNRWDQGTAKARLPTVPRYWPAGTSLGSRICVVGGAEDEKKGWLVPGSRLHEAVECYDPAADRFSPLLPLPGGRYAPSAAALGDALYVVGGLTHKGEVAWVDVLRL